MEVNRRTGESFTVDDARCSLSRWCQPGAAQAFVAKGKGHARDVGFLARCLPSAPTSTQGYRQTTTHRMETKNLDNFTAITRQLLGKYLSDDGVLCTETTVLEFQADAAEEWRYFCKQGGDTTCLGRLSFRHPRFRLKNRGKRGAYRRRLPRNRGQARDSHPSGDHIERDRRWTLVF